MKKTRKHSPPDGAVAVIGGSGIYRMEGISDVEERRVKTPFGAPSDAIVCGNLAGRRVLFLPRHGRGHRILPHEVNSRANIWALKSLGADWILSLSAVGSLREEMKPRDVVIPDQVFDRTRMRPSTFFGDGLVGHVVFGEPYCPLLRRLLIEACRELTLPVHDGGTYVCMEGPAFSTRAESEEYRRRGFSVIGMTNLPEAKLAREAEIAFATVALVTDYDCWHPEHDHVTVEMVIANLQANAEHVKAIIRHVVPRVPRDRTSPAHDALRNAIMTDRKLWPVKTVKKLRPIIGRYL